MRNYYNINKLYKNNKVAITGGSINNIMDQEPRPTNTFIGKTFSHNYPNNGLQVSGGCSSSPCINFKYKNKNQKSGGKIRLII